MDTPTSSERARWAQRVGDADLHRRLLADLPCLHETEGRRARGALTGWIRVAAWNLQRGRRPEVLAARLRSTGGAICLLSELDSGMARTQNVDVPDAVAGGLGAGYVFGVEFVELGLGDEAEQRAAAGSSNERGLHGNAIVSHAALRDPAVVRLPDPGLAWFGAGSSQPRVGGRMAVLAMVALDGVDVQIASAHLENRGNPEDRAEQMEVLLRALDARAPGGPAIVGGDLNTLGATYAQLFDRRLVRELRRAEPTRFSCPWRTNPSSTWRGRTVSSGPTPTSPRRRRSTTLTGCPTACRSSWTGCWCAGWSPGAPPSSPPAGSRTTRA